MNSTLALREHGSSEQLRNMAERVYVIVNADDFGLSRATNDGILYAHEHGVVTSASLMVRQPAAEDAVERARDFPGLGLGLHLDLGEWVYRDGDWRPLYHVVSLDSAQEIKREIEHQLQRFQSLVGRDPTHLDSHQHVHRYEPVRSEMIQLADRLNVPLRGVCQRVRYRGDFYGQTDKGHSVPQLIAAESLLALLASLLPGISELGCHPGFDDELTTMYVRERRQETTALCDPQVKRALDRLGINAVSFADLLKLDLPA
jgi:predicted glycoside hydrolase/deacetylase ChbG (UPF0249 family)